MSIRNARILASRRTYDFKPDELRLSVLTTQTIVAIIGEQFEFQEFDIRTPPPLFQRHNRTNPPGLVFGNGSFQSSDGQIVPVRELHVSAEAVVVSVAAPSEYIDEMYDEFRAGLQEYSSPDGFPLVPNDFKIRDSSSISFQLPGLHKLLPTKVIADALPPGARGEETEMAVKMTFSLHLANEKYDSDNTFLGDEFTLAPRSGNELMNDVHLSGAPLNSREHLKYLDRVAAAVELLRE